MKAGAASTVPGGQSVKGKKNHRYFINLLVTYLLIIYNISLTSMTKQCMCKMSINMIKICWKIKSLKAVKLTFVFRLRQQQPEFRGSAVQTESSECYSTVKMNKQAVEWQRLMCNNIWKYDFQTSIPLSFSNNVAWWLHCYI